MIGALALLALSGAASASLVVGVNDDAPKDAGVSSWFYSTMASEGLGLNALTIRWDEGSPNDIPQQDAVSQAIAKAKAAGIQVELDIYPLHSQVFTGGNRCAPNPDPEGCGDTSQIQAFASWAASVARTFPTVHQFVVMNECNQPLFVNPQWDSSGNNQSAEICGRALAAAYDAIKGVNGSDFVWGVGLSPRGNDQPNATSNSSTSPVNFLAALGKWFTAFQAKTGRTKPIMDGFDFHPYPIPQSLPFATGYSNPNEASVTNLSRIYQAFYDAFKGTVQQTIGQQSGGGLPVSLNETGIQTDSSAHASAYTGTETSATAAGGVFGDTATESYQANWYQQMLALVACDPNVQVVNIFHLIDESALAGWQSGLYYADQSPKQAAQVVQAFTSGGEACQGGMKPWTPAGVTAATTTTTTTAAKGPTAPKGPTVPAAPKGCVAACAATLKSEGTACTGAKATKKACTTALAATEKQLASLLKASAQAKHITKQAKVQLAAEIATFQKAVTVGKTLLKSLKK
ncbi:MAG: cellulase family glycosylhydrolase [Actinobacteria bacterium]|nr:cellulase family glycosylhydrolase [Actinomycetota bacterium]